MKQFFLNKRQSTELAKYIWNLKDSGTKFNTEKDILIRTKTKFNYRNDCKLFNLKMQKQTEVIKQFL